MENNTLCFDLPVFDVHFVTAQHYGNVLAHTHQVTMPVGHVFIGHSRSYIKHDDCTLSYKERQMHMLNQCCIVKVAEKCTYGKQQHTLDVISISQASELLLSGCVPYVIFDGSSVGVEDQGMYLNSKCG